MKSSFLFLLFSFITFAKVDTYYPAIKVRISKIDKGNLSDTAIWGIRDNIPEIKIWLKCEEVEMPLLTSFSSENIDSSGAFEKYYGFVTLRDNVVVYNKSLTLSELKHIETTKDLVEIENDYKCHFEWKEIDPGFDQMFSSSNNNFQYDKNENYFKLKDIAEYLSHNLKHTIWIYDNHNNLSFNIQFSL